MREQFCYFHAACFDSNTFRRFTLTPFFLHDWLVPCRYSEASQAYNDTQKHEVLF